MVPLLSPLKQDTTLRFAPILVGDIVYQEPLSMHCCALNPTSSVTMSAHPGPLGRLHSEPSGICDVIPLVQGDSLHRTEGKGAGSFSRNQSEDLEACPESLEVAGDGSLVYGVVC